MLSFALCVVLSDKTWETRCHRFFQIEIASYMEVKVYMSEVDRLVSIPMLVLVVAEIPTVSILVY
jgi:hypothetical protein